MAPKKIAVVGSGVSGLGAAWLLAKQPGDFTVTVYEAGSYLGGHTHTVDIPTLDKKKTVPVDTGFIVCNPVTYPNFLALMRELRVPIDQTDMSFAVSRNKGEFEWCGDNLWTVFAQRKNLNPWAKGTKDGGMWRMIYDIVRFHEEAKKIALESDRMLFDPLGQPLEDLDEDKKVHPLTGVTLVDFFKARTYSDFFYENYVVPMTSAIWSTPADMAFDRFPVLTLFRFMRNHQLLQIGGRPKWRTVNQGSRSYVTKILTNLPDVRLNTAVQSIKRNGAGGKIVLTDSAGNTETYDHIIMATHTDQALKILGEDASSDEKKILGSVKYLPNRLVLHQDTELMPKSRNAWAAWNYLTKTSKETSSPVVCLTYWMNRLQPFVKLTEAGMVFATLNPLYEPKKELILGEYEYDHPLYSPETIAAQEQLPLIQNQNGITYCGAWTNYGFHEDALTSGLLAAVALGADCPFAIHMNGGFPTLRQPLSPPEWAAAKGVKVYKTPAPLYLPHTPEHEKKTSNPAIEIVLAAGMTVFAAVCVWIAFNVDLGF
ncbi:hypothetical protein PhCBS80983_g02187 [Powellomyces hirtus]|uniref:Amine oxidase domain-containing protein n=1 Tax=Powellomyces hirtus TaxID=109895 RepID=A0A507E6S0_9FUNG|nr:hypothetical protein PhCBS80983_g02187 [Powellomyces hirtus]